jgi:tetratricopeptide (TPR) repeat protein
MKVRFLLSSFLMCGLISFVNAERPENEVPEYGGSQEHVSNSDPQHSKGASDLGWKYFYQGDLDTAIKRFNQAWLLDEKNYEAYWGFGIICGKRAVSGESPKQNIEDSIKYLEKAISLTYPNTKILTDLGVSELNYAGYLNEQAQKEEARQKLEKANETFQKAAKLDSTYPLLFENWSYTLAHLGKIQEAKEKMQKAESLGIKFPDDYKKELLSQSK